MIDERRDPLRHASSLGAEFRGCNLEREFEIFLFGPSPRRGGYGYRWRSRIEMAYIELADLRPPNKGKIRNFRNRQAGRHPRGPGPKKTPTPSEPDAH